MADSDPKADLKLYLQGAREALIWKLDRLSEYNIRRPLVPPPAPTSSVWSSTLRVGSFVYLGDTFGRPSGEPLLWLRADAEPSADMWATADETSEEVIELYHRAWVHSDRTIDALALDDVGHVPHWPDDQTEVTLNRIVMHVISDTQRHAGHADIIRELIDGAVGLVEGNGNMPPGDHQWWDSRRTRLEAVAEQADGSDRAHSTRSLLDGEGDTPPWSRVTGCSVMRWRMTSGRRGRPGGKLTSRREPTPSTRSRSFHWSSVMHAAPEGYWTSAAVKGRSADALPVRERRWCRLSMSLGRRFARRTIEEVFSGACKPA